MKLSLHLIFSNFLALNLVIQFYFLNDFFLYLRGAAKTHHDENCNF